MNRQDPRPDPIDPERLADLIQCAQSGDLEARNRIFELYLDSVHAVISGRLDARLRAKVDTMEIVQSGMRDALGDLQDYRDQGTGSFYRWLCRIVEHKMFGKGAYWRAQRRDVRREVPLEGPGESSSDSSEVSLSPPSPATVPPDRVAREERDRIVREEIERLDEPHRSVLRLYADGMTDLRIGERIGKSADAVRWLRAQGMRKIAPRLRSRLGTRPPEG